MSWLSKLNIFKRSKKRHTFSDSERQLSANTRFLKQQIKKKQEYIKYRQAEQELDELNDMLGFGEEEEEDENENDSMEQMLMQSLMAGFLNQAPGTAPVSNQDSTSPPTEEQPGTVPGELISDEELLATIKRFPKQQINVAKKLSDKLLFEAIKGHMPTLDIHTINRAIVLFRENF